MNPTKLTIYDMDGTLYQFPNASGNDGITKTKFFSDIRSKIPTFVQNYLSLPPEKVTEILAELPAKYGYHLSIGLEKEYGIPRSEFFNETWNLRPENYLEKDTALRDTLLRLPGDRAILTLAPKIWTDRVLSFLNLNDLFSKRFYGESDIRKPDEEAYRKVIESFNTSPSGSTMIDDEPRNLLPAKKIGMSTVLISPKTNADFDITIPRLHSLPSLFQQ